MVLTSVRALVTQMQRHVVGMYFILWKRNLPRNRWFGWNQGIQMRCTFLSLSCSSFGDSESWSYLWVKVLHFVGSCSSDTSNLWNQGRNQCARKHLILSVMSAPTERATIFCNTSEAHAWNIPFRHCRCTRSLRWLVAESFWSILCFHTDPIFQQTQKQLLIKNDGTGENYAPYKKNRLFVHITLHWSLESSSAVILLPAAFLWLWNES